VSLQIFIHRSTEAEVARKGFLVVTIRHVSQILFVTTVIVSWKSLGFVTRHCI